MARTRVKRTFKSLNAVKDYIYTKDLSSRPVREILKGVKLGSINSMLRQSIKKGNIKIKR